MSKNKTYITKNRLGIYYFQYSISRFANQTGAKYLFRKSLRTRDREKALHLARYLWVIMDTITKKHFKSEEDYLEAIKLLKEYNDVISQDSVDFSGFLRKLSEHQNNLLNLAIENENEHESEDSQKIQAEAMAFYNDRFKILQTIGELKRKGTNSTLNKIEQRLRKLEETTSEKHRDEGTEILLSEAIDKWKEYKQRTTRINSYQTTFSRIGVFKQSIDDRAGKDIYLSEIDKELIKSYFKKIRSITAKTNTNVISISTMQYYVQVLNDFINWVILEDYKINQSLIKTIKWESKQLTQEKKQTKEVKRVDFSEEDIKLIFLTKAYRSGTFIRASDYWVLLISLFTGARLSEIAQLKVDDLVNKNGTWLFDINEDNEKQVKTKSSIREFVIHQELIKLDLIGYRDAVKAKGKQDLFPHEVRDKTGKYSAIQKRLSRYIKECGIQSTDLKKKSQHSFRHTVETKLRDKGVLADVINSIIGHSSDDRSTGNVVYNHAKYFDLQKEAMHKLKYDVDLSLIRRWNHCEFSKNELGS